MRDAIVHVVVCLGVVVPMLGGVSRAQRTSTVHVVPPEARQAEGNAISTHVGFDKVRFVQAYTGSYVPANTTIHESSRRRKAIAPRWIRSPRSRSLALVTGTDAILALTPRASSPWSNWK